MKTCNTCKKSKDLSEYCKNIRGKGGYANICKECTKPVLRDYRLRKQFGINTEEFNEIQESQGGGCKICGSETNGSKGFENLAVDHCHRTGKLRGLLCGACNVALGKFKDNPSLVYKAAEYLENADTGRVVPMDEKAIKSRAKGRPIKIKIFKD